MVKTLRFLLVAFMAMVFAPLFAEDIIWEEDWSGVTEFKVNPSSFNSNYVFTGFVLNGDGSLKSGTTFYNEKLAGGEAPELLIAKNGGSFTATIALNGKSGDMTLSYLCNKSITISSAQKDIVIGEKIAIGNSYELPVMVPAGTESLILEFVNNTSANARLDNIKLYQGTAKKPAGLSWGKASTSVTFGGDYALIPTLQNTNNLAVECTSSNDSVCTVTNAGVISVVGIGIAKVSAVFAGNDEYEAQTVSVEITVKPADDPDAKGGKNNPYLINDTTFLNMVMALNDSVKKPKSQMIYVKGFITNIEEVSTEHGNATFKIAAVNEKDAEIKLKVFRSKYLEKSSFISENLIKEGDEIIVCGQIQWYYSNGEGEPQFAQGCYIYSHNGNTKSGIENVKAQTRFNGAIYNLRGQRVMTPAKGLYIKDGKKFFVK